MSKTLMNVPAGFARLLATENIGVRVNPSAATASFDTKRRVLTMPNWNASDRLRDMLIGHEVAHAIFTDAGDLPTIVRERVGEPFHIAKDYLNVVEDARIDRLIQRRYAGLRRDYRAGYSEMIEKDFFGVGDRDPNSLPFIDRINLHFKHYDGIEFSADEQIFVDRIAKAETFDEVCDIARDLLERSAEQNEGEEESSEMSMPSPDAADNDDEETAEQGSSEGEEESAGDGTMDGGEEETETEDTSDKNRSTKVQSAGEGGETDLDADQASGTGCARSGQGSPIGSQTQKSLDSAIQENTAAISDRFNQDGAGFVVPRLNEIQIDKIIYPYSKILLDAGTPASVYREDWNKFQTAAKPNVSHLSAMFDRKKAAAINARTQVAKTGRLDMGMLHKYKMTEDIFLRNRIEVKGKNHGVLVFVDWSGSMADNMWETLSQAILLAMFCKKASIPFRVYGFTTWLPETNNAYGQGFYNEPSTQFYANKTPTLGDCLYLRDFTLLEIFSSEMDKKDFDTMATHMMGMRNGYGAARCLNLGGTPLNESIVAAMRVAGDFRQQYRIDVLNSIWLTDGEGGSVMNCNTATINNPNNGRVYSNISRYDDTSTMMQIFKDQVRSNTIGFRLEPRKRIERTLYYSNNSDSDTIIKNFRKVGFIEQPSTRYDTYFLMDKKIAVTLGENTMDELPENATTTRVLNAFRKDLTNRNLSRPLLNVLTDKIAKEIV